MEEKTLLIKSMQKLINHVVINRKNQEEIFASLSRSDFKKIIENLDDDSERLRKTSMTLLTLLLYRNPPLKQKFCSIMNIPLVPGRIALNNKLCSSSILHKSSIQNEMISNMKEVYTLVKQPIKQYEQQSLYWFIHYEHRRERVLQIQFATPPNIQNIHINQLLDPIDCMIGFVLHQTNFPKPENEHRPPIIAPRQTKRPKNDYESHGNYYLVNNFLNNTNYKQENAKNEVQLININQSMNLSRPGYATDRQMVPKEIKLMEKVTFSPESKRIYPKTTTEIAQSPRLQFKAHFTDSQRKQRAKYKQIKTTSNSPNKRPAQNFDRNINFYESSPINQSGGWMMNSADKSMNPPPRQEFIYESLKDQRFIQKYQV